MCTHGSVVACGLDGETGEMFERRLTPDHREIPEWIGGLPEPVAAVAAAQPARRLPGARVAGLPAQRRRSLGHASASYTCAVFGSSSVKRIDSRHEHGENSTVHEINNQRWHFMQSDEGCLPHSL